MDPNIQAATGAARVPPARAGLGLGDLVRITPAAADARGRRLPDRPRDRREGGHRAGQPHPLC